MNRIIKRAPEIVRKWVHAQFGFAKHFVLIARSISYKKWVQRERCLFKTHLPYTIIFFGSHRTLASVTIMGNQCQSQVSKC